MADLAEQLLDEEEGTVATAYADKLGFLTIGRGCCVDKRIRGAGLCQAAIEAQNAHDSATARHLATLYPGFADMNPVRQAVIISMAFQMGAKPLGWRDFTAALSLKDYSRAAAAGRDTQWARTQTPSRAEREMEMLATGVWVPHGG